MKFDTFSTHLDVLFLPEEKEFSNFSRGDGRWKHWKGFYADKNERADSRSLSRCPVGRSDSAAPPLDADSLSTAKWEG